MTRSPLTCTTLIGFDSAWADKDRAPGAICALAFNPAGVARFEPPVLVGFEAAAAFVEAQHEPDHRMLVAIDQPTIVRNVAGMRPCERAVASVASWSGGGIQPAYRGKLAMFGDAAPIWRFLHRLDLRDDPETARSATRGSFVMEVFPALALLAFEPSFAASGAGPRYNPARPTFRQDAWRAVCKAVTRQAETLGLEPVAVWCRTLDVAAKPRKALQDRLDAVICLLVAAIWLQDRTRCAMVGDLATGYIVAPVADGVRLRLAQAATRLGIAIV